MKNTDYWQNRFNQLEKAQYNTSAEQIQSIYELFTKSERVIQNKINNWCMRFADNNNITYAEALKLLKNDELKELKWDVNEYIAHGQENSINQKWLKELENASSKVHISYLQSIQLQCRMEIEKLYAEYDDLLDKTVKNAYEERYYKTAYEIQLGTQSGKFLSGLDTDLVNDIIHKPWALDEKNFSERIWNDKTKLINTLHNSLTKMCIVGEGPEKAVKEVADKMHVSRQQAAKVVNTEVAAFTAKAQQDCFKELDIEQFEVVETLDSHTCKRCADMDGKHFPMNQYKIGITVPPFHPNCRGCTAPYFDDEFNHIGKRAASDDTGKIYYVPTDMTYKEWKKTFIDGNKETRDGLEFYEFEDEFTPNTGNVLIDDGTEDDDIKLTRWLFNKIGGNVHCLKANSKIGKMPDAKRNGIYWEFKTPTSKNAIGDRIKKANKQLSEILTREKNTDAERGMLIDISNINISKEEALKEIKKEIELRCHHPITVIVKYKDNIYSVIKKK